MNEAQKLLSAIRDMAPLISTRSAQIESARELPGDLLGDLVAAGCFRIFGAATADLKSTCRRAWKFSRHWPERTGPPAGL